MTEEIMYVLDMVSNVIVTVLGSGDLPRCDKHFGHGCQLYLTRRT